MEMCIKAYGSKIKCVTLMESITLLMEILTRAVLNSVVNLLATSLVNLKEKAHLTYLA